MFLKSKVKKKIYALFAVFGVIVGSLCTTITADEKIQDSNETIEGSIQQTIDFIDVLQSDWFYPYVTYLTENKIVNGMTETEFEPKGTFTVAQSAAIITRYLGLESKAGELKTAMETLGVAGADKWYAGYIQLMHETGIIDVSEYGCTVNGTSISIDSTELLDAPIKRYEFATFVTKSFDFESGNKFIHGGEYKENELELYIPFINDYFDIPEENREYILKAYYNGIFNGDDLSNFNPVNNLTRAEMAKVAAVIINPDLRTRINVFSNEYSDTYIIKDEDYIVKKQEKILKHEVTDAILECEAKGITLSDSGIEYIQQKNAPDGYEFEVRHYRKSQDGFDTEITDTMKVTDADYKNDFLKNDKFVLIIKKSFSGEIIDAYQVSLNMLGEAIYSHISYIP